MVARWPFSCGCSCYGWGLGLFTVEREMGEEGRERELERGDYFFFWLYILVDNIYYFNEKNRKIIVGMLDVL